MISNKILPDHQNKAFCTDAEWITIETKWTDYLQNLVDFGNRHCLRNFSLSLEMEYNDGRI
jgi:hypothetical protein